MKVAIYHFDKSIQVVNLGDIHFANRFCDRALVKRNIEFIRGHPEVYWYSTGDLLEAAVPGCPGWGDADMSTDEEKEQLCEWLLPIANKCLGFVRSNHHRRVKRAAGLSLDKIIADKTGIPFLGATGVLCLIVGRAAYYIVLHHGVGFGRKDGAKAGNLTEPFLVMPGADIYSLGHTHSYMNIKNSTYYLDRKRQRCAEMEVDFVYTGHYLNYSDSYADDKLLRPKPKGSSIISLRYCETGKIINKKTSFDLLHV